jgi:uncharacterized OB-fold protein
MSETAGAYIDDVFPDGLAEGRFMAQQCADCSLLRWPVGLVCPRCWCRDWEWTDLVGRDGDVHSVVTYRRAFHSSVVDDIPYSMAVVSLDSARILVRVAAAETESMEVGARVRLVATDSEKPATRVVLVSSPD